MNERIRALVEQAHDTVEFNYAPPQKIFNKEKFAELMVLEFVRYFNEDYKRDFSVLWREDLSEGIMKHFGVKDE